MWVGRNKPPLMDQDAAKLDPLLEQMEIHLTIMGFPQEPKTRPKKKDPNRIIFAQNGLKFWTDQPYCVICCNTPKDLTTIDIVYSCSTCTKIGFKFTLSKQSTVEGLLIQIKEKLKLSYLDAELRLLRIVNHVISEVIDPSVKIQNVRDDDEFVFEELRVELIPEEDKNLGLGDYLIRVHHFKKNEDVRFGEPAVSCFANPFLLVIHEGETIAQVRSRLGMKLKVCYEELSKWRFLLWELGLDGRYLEETDVASDLFKEKIASLVPGQKCLEKAFVLAAFNLGLEHSKSAYDPPTY